MGRMLLQSLRLPPHFSSRASYRLPHSELSWRPGAKAGRSSSSFVRRCLCAWSWLCLECSHCQRHLSIRISAQLPCLTEACPDCCRKKSTLALYHTCHITDFNVFVAFRILFICHACTFVAYCSPSPANENVNSKRTGSVVCLVLSWLPG